MKKFETPEIEITRFMAVDVITTSDTTSNEDLGDNQTPPAVRP